jgi:hypothetical protein
LLYCFQIQYSNLPYGKFWLLNYHLWYTYFGSFLEFFHLLFSNFLILIAIFHLHQFFLEYLFINFFLLLLIFLLLATIQLILISFLNSYNPPMYQIFHLESIPHRFESYINLNLVEILKIFASIVHLFLN